VFVDLLTLLVAFVVCSALAGLLGAANLGTALTFGVFGFTLVLLWQLLLRRDR
jgi:ABC-type methionine transport system permease subunit